MSRLRTLFLVLALGGCGGATSEAPPDTAYVEILRLRISTVRHAIDETREAIALSQGAPYLPELYLRLGEFLSEEAKYHYRVAAERQQSSTEALHVPQVRLLKERAIATYRMILRAFPDTPIADQVLFNIAHEHRELGNFDEMRATLEDLVQRFPNSPRRAEGLLVLGDYHFDRSELEQSRRYYEQITQGPPTRITALAHYKLAWVEVNLGDCARALAGFERALDVARQAEEEPAPEETAETEGGETDEDGETLAEGEQAPPPPPIPRDDASDDAVTSQAIDVRRAALVDLVYCYSQEREANDAVPYLREHSHDRATYVAGLERMARRFATMDEARGALAAVRELLRLGAGDEFRVEDARQLHTALRALEDYRGVGEDVGLMLRVLHRYETRPEVPREARARLATEFEQYARDLLTRAQRRANAAPEAQRAVLALDVAAGYRAYVDAFPTGEHSIEMRLNMGDALALAGRPFEAGTRTLDAALEMPATTERRDALYDAVVRLQDALRDSATNVTHEERVLARASLRRAAVQLLRHNPDADRTRRVKFAIAQSYYDEGRFREAIDRLTAIAYEYPRTEEANASIRLVLDSLNTLNDAEGLIAYARRFLEASSPADDAMRSEIQPILASAEQRMLDEVSLEAAGGEGGDVSVLIDFARRNQGSELGERALVNAFVAGRAAGNTSQLYELGDQIAQQYPQSEQLPGILSTLGQLALARFEVDRAAQLLARAAEANEAQRTQLLLASGALLEELGKYDDAQQRYTAAMSGAADARARGEPLTRLSAILEQRGDQAGLLSQLGPHAEDADPIVLARLGLAQVASGAPDQAEMSLQRVLALGDAAPQDALARAHYGMGEVLWRTLQSYPALDSPDFIEEYMTLLDVTQQSYINAARQGTPDYTPAALARLATITSIAADRVRNAQLPADLPADARQMLQEALSQRVEELGRGVEEATNACAEQAYAGSNFSPVVLMCLKGERPEFTLPPYDVVRPRGNVAEPRGAEPLRQTLSRNAEDTGALRELGTRFLEGNDPHVARLVFASAAEHGGGPVEQNLLGIANYRIGNFQGALEAFSQAARGGLEAARQNLAAVLREKGLDQAARRILERIPAGREGGMLLQRGGRR